MSGAAADRNLLLGIIALQMDFITKEALIAAMHAWVLNKSLPLSQVLQDQGALSTARRTVLDAMVEEHIKVHNDDAQKSLAAVSSIGSVQEELSRIADPDLQSSLPLVSAARKEPDDPFRTVAPSSLGESTWTGSRFRILRPHAKGGLGQVSVALDQELDRPVALKEIQDRHADDPASRARFVQEAEITGKLEHPGIIPVYSLGHDASGRPFYAMRFIHGDSLKQAIAAFHGDEGLKRDAGAQAARLRELLRRFTDVCNAVAYAHSRGVLHRDLKPGNIMLGPYGETLLVDWGLAKALGASPAEPPLSVGPSLTEGPIRLSGPSGSRAETVAGSMVGTPAYASPEQVAGRLDLLGPASDVYGLGATLYALLTGRPPIEADELEEVLRRVQKGQIPPPRSIDPTIPKPLEAICLKAMALRPEGRYPSARALAEDVTRWLDDAPVSAYRDPVSVRVGRWMRRHRTLVTSAAAVLIFGSVVLAAYEVALAGMNRALDAKNTQLAGKNRELERQRQRAEEREALAIDAVKKFRDAVEANPELKNRPELDALRKALLQEPLEFFRKLRDQLKSDRDTSRDALTKLAEASYDLAYTTWEIGTAPDALHSFAESLAIWERLARENPAVTLYQSRQANSHHSVGLGLATTGQPAAALESYRRALAIQERLARENPTTTQYQSDQATSLRRIGILLNEMGHPAEALESHSKALAIRERLARANPAVTDYQSDLAASHDDLGHQLQHMGRRTEALESHRRASAIQERLVRDHPSVTAYLEGLAESHKHIGNLLLETGRPAEALESFRWFMEVCERLAHDNPSVTGFLSQLAAGHTNIGRTLDKMGRATEAMESHCRAIEISERLARDHPSSHGLQSDLGAVLNNAAMIDMVQGRWQEARGRLERAIEYQRKALAAMPHHPQYQEFLQRHLFNLARVYRKLNEPAKARELLERVLEIVKSQAREHPSVPDHQSLLGAVLNNLADAHRALNQPAKARELLERAAEHQRKALAAVPRHPMYRQYLSNHLINLAQVYRSLKQPSEAVRAAREYAAFADASPAELYNAACALALNVPNVPEDQKQPLATEAIHKLKAAIAAGWSDAQHTSRDPDLAPLRDRDDFPRLLAELFDRGFPADPFAP
jgi:serine/threonine-protein kinase